MSLLSFIPGLSTLRLAASVAGIAAIAGAGAYGGFKIEQARYLKEKAELDTFVARMKLEAEEAIRVRDAQIATDNAARKELEAQSAADRKAIEYLRSHPIVRVRLVTYPRSSTLPVIPQSTGSPDATAGKSGSGDASTVNIASVDPAFVAACAQDAISVLQWQEWARNESLSQ